MAIANEVEVSLRTEDLMKIGGKVQNVYCETF